MGDEPKAFPGGAPGDGRRGSGRRRDRVFATIFILIFLIPPAVAGVVGYRVARWETARQGSWESPGEVRDAIRLVQMQETVAGQFRSQGIPLEGVESCYYPGPIDFTQVVWVSRDIPTPFLNFAPRPGPFPGGFVNRQQFRYNSDLKIPKPQGTCRIFLVGGSTAFGTCARNNDTTIAGYLEQYLNAESQRYGRRFQVVTAANANWNSSHERIMIENRLLELEPDVVISLSGYNDVGCGLVGLDINKYRGSPDLYFVILANAMLKQEAGEGFPLQPPGAEEPVSVRRTGERLRRNAELSHAALQMVGADFCFALQPILSTAGKVRTSREELMLERASNSIPAEQFVERFNECRYQLSAVKSPHFHFWDLTRVFDAQNGSDVFIDQCHFGDKGNDLIAKRMQELLAPVLTARFHPDAPAAKP